MEMNPNKFNKDYENMQDFSIKDGQKISLNFGENKLEKNQPIKPKANLRCFFSFI